MRSKTAVRRFRNRKGLNSIELSIVSFLVHHWSAVVLEVEWQQKGQWQRPFHLKWKFNCARALLAVRSYCAEKEKRQRLYHLKTWQWKFISSTCPEGVVQGCQLKIRRPNRGGSTIIMENTSQDSKPLSPDTWAVALAKGAHVAIPSLANVVVTPHLRRTLSSRTWLKNSLQSSLETQPLCHNRWTNCAIFNPAIGCRQTCTRSE